MIRLAIRRRRRPSHRFALRFEGLEDRRLMSVGADSKTVGVPVGLYATPVPADSVQAGLRLASPSEMNPHATIGGPYNPAQIRHAYGFDQLPYDGAGQTIAIIDAYDNPNVASDLATFSTTFGLPQANLTKVYLDINNQVTATPPPFVDNWALEIALDVQWAHAIAPRAKILLVEAASATTDNLFAAVRYAVAQGANQVSMSFGAGEYSDVSADDFYFRNTTASYFASAGDGGAEVEAPAVSPYVVGVGGTTLTLDSASGNRVSETAWSGSGGGTSRYVSRPSFQAGFQASPMRGVPDVAYDADPYTGVYVYYSATGGGFYQVGGTSAGAPQWAGLAALVNQGRAARGLGTISSGLAYGLNTALYSLAGGSSYTNPNGDFLDITAGSNGISATTGYDTVTGLGSPIANKLVPDLIAYGTSTTTAPSVGDSGFEAVAVGSGSYYSFQYDPTGSPWSYTGTAGVTGNSSGFTSGGPAAPAGAQVAFLQALGSVTQVIPNWAAGTYTLSLLAAQRSNWGTPDQSFQVLVDGRPVATIAPGSTSYQSYKTGAFTVAAGSHTIGFVGLNGNGDNTAFLDNITIATATPPPPVGDSGFEAVAVGSGSYYSFQYDPTGSPWSYTGTAGVTGNGSGFTSGGPAAPAGAQVAFLQALGSVTQVIPNWAAGTYTLSLLAAQRSNWGTPNQSFQVLVDNVVVATYNPSSTSYQSFTTGAFTVAAGSHSISFVGLNGNGDNTVFLDNITLAAA